MRNYLLIGIFLLFGLKPISGQDNSEINLLNEVKQKLAGIEAFSANVEIEINVNFINIPNKKAIVYYKKPDKVRFKSKDFIMVPKHGAGFSLYDILSDDYSVIYMGMETHNEQSLKEYKIIPLNSKSDIVLATLLINHKENLVSRMEIDTRKSGYFITDFYYGMNKPLPDYTSIKFEVNEFKFALRFIGKIDIDKSEIKSDEMGEVILRYSGYKINQKIDNKFFEEDTVGVK